MLEKFKLIFKDFKKAIKYSEIYNKNITNPYNNQIKNQTYVWVEKLKD